MKQAKTTLQQVYDELLYKGLVSSQSDFADKIGKTKGYVSKLLKSGDPVPPAVREPLNEKFSVSIQWLASNGKNGEIFDNERITQALKIATGNPSVVVEDLNDEINKIENDNKLTKDKDRISYTPNEKDALFSTPVLTNGDNFMKELFELLREEQRQRSMLIEQQGHLIAKIPDVERKQNNVKERQVKSA